MTYQGLAQQALDVQNASNLSGVVKSFAGAMDVLWAEASQRNEGTYWINHHPIVTLFLDKLASLNGSYIQHGHVLDAFRKVREIAEGKEQP